VSRKDKPSPSPAEMSVLAAMVDKTTADLIVSARATAVNHGITLTDELLARILLVLIHK
jgi:hypothetical protein